MDNEVGKKELLAREILANTTTLMNKRPRGKAEETTPYRVTEKEKALINYIRKTGFYLVEELRRVIEEVQDINTVQHIKKLVTLIEERNVFTLDDLVETEFMTQQQANYLTECMKQNKNIIITGPTGVGKTTLLRALLDVQCNVRMLVVEERPEIAIGSNVEEDRDIIKSTKISLEDMTKLLVVPVRRVVVGEIRDEVDVLGVVSALTSGCSIIGTGWTKENWKRYQGHKFSEILANYSIIQVHVDKELLFEGKLKRRIVKIEEI